MKRRINFLRANRIITAAAVVAIVVLAYIAGNVLGDLRDLNERMERYQAVQIYEVCESGNETRRVLARVLDTLAEPRDDDEPGDYAERQRLRDAVDQYVQPQECPPRPEGAR